MKFVVLIEDGDGNLDEIVDAIKDKKSLFIDTKDCDEEREYECLFGSIELFSQSTKDVMLVSFSGRESIVRNIGEERPEMIVALSYNKNSNYYNDNPVNVFLDLMHIFEKGD